MNPEQLGQAVDGAKLQALLPYLEYEIGKLEAALDSRTAQLISQNKLTPEVSQQVLYEKHAYRRILSRFRQHIALGNSIGESIAVDMEANEPYISA